MDRSYDLVVIGAGIVGLSCAWRAAQSGMSVLCLERDEPGAGASGVAAGMLAPVTEADFGEQELLKLNLESRELWPGFAAELEELTAMPTGYSETGRAGGGRGSRRRRGIAPPARASSASWGWRANG